MNKIGWSIPGFPSQTVKTKFAGLYVKRLPRARNFRRRVLTEIRSTGAEKLVVPTVLRSMQIVCEKGKEIIGDEPRTLPDYTLEHKHIQWAEQPAEDKYRYVSEIARYKFFFFSVKTYTYMSSMTCEMFIEGNSLLLSKPLTQLPAK